MLSKIMYHSTYAVVNSLNLSRPSSGSREDARVNLQQVKAFVTPGFEDKTECITIYILGSNFIHIETS